MRRTVSLVSAVVIALVLAGCAGLPTTGPVQPVPQETAQAEVPDITFRPDAPQAGASPQQIVEGFVRAASGPQNDWDTARLFLAPDFRDSWEPEAGVIVDVLSDRVYTPISDEALDLQVTPRATVDEHGSYAPSDGGTAAPLSYALAQQSDGEWRITSAPNGILLDEDFFRSVFRSYSLMYFDPTWEFLVPDTRFFPTYNAATRIADALVNGAPSAWLADAVKTAFPETVDLLPSVPAIGGVAQAQLSQQALTLDQTTLDRMQTQLASSLASAQVSQVEMLVDGTRLDADRVATEDTSVDQRALVLSEDGFGFLVSGDLTPIPALSPAVVTAAPSAIELARDRGSVAVRMPDGSASRISDDGRRSVIDDRKGLLAPAIDPFGIVWTVPSASPSDLHATTPGGELVEPEGAWSGASRIDSLQISRDGARMAAIIGFGSRTVLVVAGISRDADGVPIAIGDQITLANLDGTGRDVAWLDDLTVGALTGPDDDVTFVEQVVGGLTTTFEAPAGAAEISGVNTPSAVRLRTADGALFVRRSSNWVQTAAGISVLAVLQGSP
ncbi:LpqB family beta-propeller domain-containing protein [Microbacterium sp. cx-59]|uniref:LpqB family beta-propeller domain-containing protein n=1 Tax=Microbacterium sp. cx-59 TaxID=2891207 RepID=UPI001E483996|nr:LpqB family beta-propeller domain-containing protein [Microbacterium sp. cx-59]MCC4909580.1 LpqB family beta-propeller domain-containing protein [Microbacterium sp. cx-59]